MILGHVIALDPTVRQKRAMQRAAGVARFAFNWGLEEWNRSYAAGEKPTAMKLKKRFNAVKAVAFPWIYDSPKDANDHAFADLGSAFGNYIASLKKRRKGQRVERPRFKKKGKHDTFYVSNDRFYFLSDGRHVHLPVIGVVKLSESLRLAGRIIAGHVKRIADRWYLSVRVENDFRVPNTPGHAIVGVDLGLTTAIVPSHGDSFDAPKPLKAALRKLGRANRSLGRKTKGGANRQKAKIKVARLYRHVANVRNDFLHKVTTKIARENQVAVIEDLNVQGMFRNRSLARAASDIGMGGFRRMLEYKGPIYGCDVVVADRWFPSSKRCSACGNVKDELSLKQRVYECEACGLVMDRDRNAALNLEAYPGLPGNSRKATPVDTSASVWRPRGRRTRAVVETGIGERTTELVASKSRHVATAESGSEMPCHTR